MRGDTNWRKSEEWEQFQNRFVVKHPEIAKEELQKMDDAFAAYEGLSEDMRLPFISWCIIKGEIKADILAGQVNEIIEGLRDRWKEGETNQNGSA